MAVLRQGPGMVAKENYNSCHHFPGRGRFSVQGQWRRGGGVDQAIPVVTIM